MQSMKTTFYIEKYLKCYILIICITVHIILKDFQIIMKLGIFNTIVLFII